MIELKGFWYDEAGNVKKATNADGGITKYSYDLLNRLVKRTDPEGNVFRTDYDRNGNVKKETDGRGSCKEFFYDGLNRAVEVRNELGHSSYREYDSDGNLKKLINEEGAVTEYFFDLKNQVKKVKDALGNATKFAYDSMGRVKTETNARGAVTSYEYTSGGAIKTVTKDVTHGQNAAIKEAVTSYAYNANGWLTSETNPNGETVHYVHDMLGRVVEKRDAMGKSEYFAYDANSRITQVTDRNGNSTQYFYDQNGNVIEAVDALGGRSLFSYDAMNRLVSVKLNRKYAAGGVSEQQATLYEYNKNGLLTRQVNAASGEKRSVKKEADSVANAMGMTLSTAINIFVRQMVSERAIPFKIHIAENEAAKFHELIDGIRAENEKKGFLSDDEINAEIIGYRKEKQWAQA